MSLEANFLLQRSWFPELICKDHALLLQPQYSELAGVHVLLDLHIIAQTLGGWKALGWMRSWGWVQRNCGL